MMPIRTLYEVSDRIGRLARLGASTRQGPP
jgi:hypothetical protein